MNNLKNILWFVISMMEVFLLCFILYITPQAIIYYTSEELRTHLVEPLNGPLQQSVPQELPKHIFVTLKSKQKEKHAKPKKKTKQKKVVKAPSNRWGISLSENERELLAKITYREAGNQGLIGQEAVVEVIFNRMVDDYYKGTLKEVVSAKGQFESWNTRNKAIPTEETYQAIDNVLNGKTNIFGFDYLYFSRGGHKKHKGYVQIGDHQFCTEG